MTRESTAPQASVPRCPLPQESRPEVPAMWMRRKHPGDSMSGGGQGVGTGWAPWASGCRGQGGVRCSGVTCPAANWLEQLAAQANPTLEEYIPGVWSLHGPVVRRNPPPLATATFMALAGEQEPGPAVQASRPLLPPGHIAPQGTMARKTGLPSGLAGLAFR